MSDPVNFPNTSDAEARKLAEAIGKLTDAARDLGNLPDALTKAATSAATGTPPGPRKPTGPDSLTDKIRKGMPTGRPEYDQLNSRPSAPPRELTAPPPPRPKDAPSPPRPEGMTDGPKKKKAKTGRLRKAWDALGKTGPGKAIANSGVGRAVSKVKDGFKGGAAVNKAVGVGGASGLAGAAGKVLPVVGAIVAVGTVLNDFRKSIENAADSALEAHRKYAELSGAQAAIFAEQDVKQMQRDMKQGNDTAGSTKELADSVNDRKEMFAPLETAMANLENTVLANLQNIMNEFLEPMVKFGTEVVKTINNIYDILPWAKKPEEEKKKKEEFVSLQDIRDNIFRDADAAQLKARAAMDRARDAARGIKPGGRGDF